MAQSTAPTPTNGSVQKRKVASVTQPVLGDPIDYTVRSTKDYRKFVLLGENRNVNIPHIKRLVESMKTKYLVCPIIVNEHYQVIDGQHRLNACIELNYPVYYIMLPGYGIEEVQMLNSNQKNWTKIDYLKSYCDSGVRAYIIFKDFMDSFPDLNFSACEAILTGRFNDGGVHKKKTIDNVTVTMKDFEQGLLAIPNVSKSISIAKKLLDYKNHYDGFSRRAFVSAVCPLFDKKIYNHKEMMHKLSTAPIKVVHCQNAEQYRLLLEDIYNYKRLKENRISLRY